MYIKPKEDNIMAKCKICEKGTLTEISYPVPREIGDEEVMVVVKYSICDYCESEQTDDQQAKENKEVMLEAREGKSA